MVDIQAILNGLPRSWLPPSADSFSGDALPSSSDTSASQKIVPRAESSMIRPRGAVSVAAVGID